jgi:hypothetical protein
MSNWGHLWLPLLLVPRLPELIQLELRGMLELLPLEANMRPQFKALLRKITITA